MVYGVTMGYGLLLNTIILDNPIVRSINRWLNLTDKMHLVKTAMTALIAREKNPDAAHDMVGTWFNNLAKAERTMSRNEITAGGLPFRRVLVSKSILTFVVEQLRSAMWVVDLKQSPPPSSRSFTICSRRHTLFAWCKQSSMRQNCPKSRLIKKLRIFHIYKHVSRRDFACIRPVLGICLA